MKPPSIYELRRLQVRFDQDFIREGLETPTPLASGARYRIGDEWVGPEEAMRRLIRRCIELDGYMQGDL